MDIKRWCDNCPYANHLPDGVTVCPFICGSCYKVGADTILNPVKGMITSEDMAYQLMARKILGVRIRKARGEGSNE